MLARMRSKAALARTLPRQFPSILRAALGLSYPLTLNQRGHMAKGKKGKKAASTMSSNFAGMTGGFIWRGEIYHRLERYSDHRHDAQGPLTSHLYALHMSFFQGLDPSTARQ